MQLNMSGETIETLLYANNKPVLELKIAYPQIMGPLSKRTENQFNDFYTKQARNLNRKARTQFYHRATQESRVAEKEEVPFTLHSFIRTFNTTYLNKHYCSVVFDRYQYFGGTHGTTVRVGNTWDLSKGFRIPLSHFFRNDLHRKQILDLICAQIERKNKNEEILFFENPLRRAKQYFNEENYYLTNNAVAIFYPLYTLAPYYAGILSFEIPFEHLNGWIKERKPIAAEPYKNDFSRFEGKLL